MTDRLELEFRLACKPAHAFRVFTEMIDMWWPRGHRRRTDSEMTLEPGAGGRLVERADGKEQIVGELIDWRPPQRLSFDWWFGVEENPTRVEIGFEENDLGTRISISHTAGLALADNVFADRVARFERGWTGVMTALTDFVNRKEPPQ